MFKFLGLLMVTSYRAAACGCILHFVAKVMDDIKVQHDAQCDAGSLLQIITGNWFLTQEMCGHRSKWCCKMHDACHTSIWIQLKFWTSLNKVGVISESINIWWRYLLMKCSILIACWTGVICSFHFQEFVLFFRWGQTLGTNLRFS